jgi:hypothetical protein
VPAAPSWTGRWRPGLTGPEPDQLRYVDGWGSAGPYTDRFLREAMFGPDHPRAAGSAVGLDGDLPGFGPYGTCGRHAFDPDRESYRAVRDLIRVRSEHLPLRRGTQCARQVRAGGGFAMPAPGGVLAWSRIFGGSEVLCVVNTGPAAWTGDVVVDAAINDAGAVLRVAGGTDPTAPAGTGVPVLHDPDGTAYVRVRELGPARVLVLAR